MSVRIIQGDCRQVLRTLPAESVHCVVTSPPYWGLRDYGTGRWEGGDPHCDHRSPTMRDRRNEDRPVLGGSVATNSAQLLLAHRSACSKCGAIQIDQQLGLESSLGEHVATMVDVFREVRRVLRKDGTVWLNYGDCYASSPNGRPAADTKALTDDDRTFRDKPFSTVGPIQLRSNGGEGQHHDRRGAVYDPDGGSKGGGPRGDNKGGGAPPSGRIVAGGFLKPKDLCGIPWRVALALQDDGWWLRQDIIWAKPNPMPESITDRCTKAHEYIFLLSKSERYYFDAEAIKEQAAYDGPNAPDAIASPYGQGFTRRAQKVPNGWDTEPGHHGAFHRATIGTKGNAKSFRGGSYVGGEPGPRTAIGNEPNELQNRNKRDVWTVATAGFAGEFCSACQSYFEGAELAALRCEKVERPEGGHTRTRWCRCGRTDAWLSHFATFPPDLIDPCIAAGCPVGGVVLDPFGGAGTTALVADRLARGALLIELRADYAEMARQRVRRDAPMFMEVAAE